jgi:hypothetical protein
MTCSPVNLFTGFLVWLVALLGVFLCEVMALVFCYFPAAMAYQTAQIFSPPNVCTGIMYSFFMIMYYTFSLCDSSVLFASVIVTEALAVAGFVVSLFTGGFIWAKCWHQHIRRSGHGIRILFRKASSDPPRNVLSTCFVSQNDSAIDQQNVTAVPVVSVQVHHNKGGQQQP